VVKVDFTIPYVILTGFDCFLRLFFVSYKSICARRTLVNASFFDAHLHAAIVAPPSSNHLAASLLFSVSSPQHPRGPRIRPRWFRWAPYFLQQQEEYDAVVRVLFPPRSCSNTKRHMHNPGQGHDTPHSDI
jgi:hypothetical protein